LEGGSYEITVNVSNENKETEASKDIEVVSSAKPLVDILAPNKDSYFVLGEQIVVEASAYHENGISVIRLVASKNGQDSLIQQLGGNGSGSYRFEQLRAYDNLVGKTTLIVEAEADNQLQTLGNDAVAINIEGIIVGKNEE